MLQVTVPASSANLGAGFDALGIALTLYNHVWMEEEDGCRIESADGLSIGLFGGCTLCRRTIFP